jgi:hypothetical protein
MTSEDLNFDVCEWCAKKFRPTRIDRRYCSRRCATFSYHALTKADAAGKRAALRCEACGDSIAGAGRTDARFCDPCAAKRDKASKRRYAVGRHAQLLEARIAVRAALTCQMCGGEIAGAQRKDRKFCDACRRARAQAHDQARSRGRRLRGGA